MNKIDILEKLTDAVCRSHTDIAPSYEEYMCMAFAVANDCGEAGRPCFHRLCSLSDKYERAHADKLFDNALNSGNSRNSLGTLFHLARTRGIALGGLKEPAEPKRCIVATSPSVSHTYTPAYVPYNASQAQEAEAPKNRLPEEPALPDPLPQGYRWPRMLQQAIDCGETDGQRDVLLLSTLTVVGCTLAPMLHFIYGHKRMYPCLQTFVVAPPASGKGVIDWVRMLVQPIHDEMMERFRKELAAYHADHIKWEQLGKDKANHPEPERPRMRALIISGNNTGTGILENLMDNEGHALIVENEADTISAAIGSEHGHWSDTLRKCFDHSPLSYNRRTNHEYRECAVTRLSLLMSGTPAQVAALIPSPENGLYSRELFYRLVGLNEWKDQTEPDDSEADYAEDYSLLFKAWGEEWRDYIKHLTSTVASIRFRLSRRQKARLNAHFSQLFSHANASEGAEMRGSVVRMAINAYRMMSVVAFLRSREVPEMLTPAPHIPHENVKDGVASAFVLAMSDDDFEAVLSLCLPLYRHACYILNYLSVEKATKRKLSPIESLMATLPLAFSRKEAVEAGSKLGIPESSIASALKRMTEKGLLVNEERGSYRFK